MPRFEPFRGLRYDLDSLRERGDVLDEVIAPPYDVVDPAERNLLAGRSRYNSIRVELPEPDEAKGWDRYEAAAALIGAWSSEGVLLLDDRPSLYAYRMTFTDDWGNKRRTVGVLGALEVTVPGEGDVLPHEQTMPKPKGDRLFLLRACRMNLSPVWGLSLAGGLSGAIDIDAIGAPDETARDDDGVVHELWRIKEPGHLDKIASSVSSAPVVIADGHHRYETALAYRSELRASSGRSAGDFDLVLALVVELAEDQLTVRPIHRLVSGLRSPAELDQTLASFFESERWRGDVGPDLLGRIDAAGAMGMVTPHETQVLRWRGDGVARPEASLDSSRLDEALSHAGAHEVAYEPSWREVTAAVEHGAAQAGFIMRPATVAQIAECARARVRMPPKTTFFWPKPRTGMVFRPVGDL